MKRLLPYIVSVLAVLNLASTASAQTREKRDSVIAFSWNDVKTFSEATGSFYSVGEKDLEKRAAGDLRAMLQAMIPGLWISESGGSYFNGVSSGMKAFGLAAGGAYSTNAKGFGTVFCLIDDVPVPFNQVLLEPNQIESITMIDGVVDRVKAGPMAGTSALSIKTRTGSYNSPLKVVVDVESGINFNPTIPEWCNGYEYASLNNLARSNSGLSPLYSQEALDGFMMRDPNDPTYPCVDYRSLMINDCFDMEKVSLMATAGNSRIKYHAALNGMRSGDLYKSTSNDLYKLNVLVDVSTRIGKWVEASASFTGLLGYRDHGNYNWANFFSVPECAYPLILGYVGEDILNDPDAEASGTSTFQLLGAPIYGVNTTFGNNYYAQMVEGGYYQYRTRSGLFRAAVDIDFGWLLPGLKSRTQVQESSYIFTQIGKSNQYLAYYWTPESGMGTRSTDHDGTKASSEGIADRTISQSLNVAENIWYDWARGGHKVHADGVFSLTDYSQTGDTDRQRLIAAIAGARYSYKDLYTVDVASEWTGSPRYMKGSRWGMFPSVGFAWNLGNEKFLKGSRVVSELKIRGQFGDTPLSDNIFGEQYMFQANYKNASGVAYGPHSSGEKWFGVNTYTSYPTTITKMAAENLTWERIREISLGVDADFFGCLRLNAEFFKYDRLGLIKNVNTVLPSLYGLSDIMLYNNYSSDRTVGYNLNLQFHKRFGDLFVTAGGFATHYRSIYTKMVDDNPTEEYQKQTGQSRTAFLGYKCIGRYSSEDEIESLPSYVTKDQLSVGDLIYEDVNGDGLVDTNDRVFIGDTNPKLRFALNFGLEWKNFDFQVIATGRYLMDYNLQGNGYFTRGSKDENLSAFVRDGLVSGDYPSLSYNQSTNNFIASSFWLRDRSYLKLQSVELGYTFDFKKKASPVVKGLRLAVKGDNLMTFSKLEYVSAEAPTAGISDRPLFSIATFNAKFTF